MCSSCTSRGLRVQVKRWMNRSKANPWSVLREYTFTTREDCGTSLPVPVCIAECARATQGAGWRKGEAWSCVGVGDSSDRVLHTIDSGRRIVELGLGFRQSKTGVGNLLSVARSECWQCEWNVEWIGDKSEVTQRHSQAEENSVEAKFAPRHLQHMIVVNSGIGSASNKRIAK